MSSTRRDLSCRLGDLVNCKDLLRKFLYETTTGASFVTLISIARITEGIHHFEFLHKNNWLLFDAVLTLTEVPRANQSYCFESIREITKQTFFLKMVHTMYMLGPGHIH